MQNEICGRECLIFNILKSKYHLRSNFLKVKKIRLLVDMIWALHVRLKNRSLVCGIKEVDSAGCRTREGFEVFSLWQVSSSLRCFGMDHFEHLSWNGSMDRLEHQLSTSRFLRDFPCKEKQNQSWVLYWYGSFWALVLDWKVWSSWTPVMVRLKLIILRTFLDWKVWTTLSGSEVIFFIISNWTRIGRNRYDFFF